MEVELPTIEVYVPYVVMATLTSSLICIIFGMRVDYGGLHDLSKCTKPNDTLSSCHLIIDGRIYQGTMLYNLSSGL